MALDEDRKFDLFIRVILVLLVPQKNFILKTSVDVNKDTFLDIKFQIIGLLYINRINENSYFELYENL